MTKGPNLEEISDESFESLSIKSFKDWRNTLAVLQGDKLEHVIAKFYQIKVLSNQGVIKSRCDQIKMQSNQDAIRVKQHD